MKVAYIQTRPKFGEVERNVENAVSKIETLGAELVVLPELFSTGYQFKSTAEALELGENARSGYAAVRLIEAAVKTGAFIVAGIAERSGASVYNSCVLVGPKGFIGLYRKAHLFSNETVIFKKGNTPFKVFDVGVAKVGMMICFDWLFPEAARSLALQGADVICHPSNLVLPHCPAAMITRCLENRVFAITANRVGAEERIKGAALTFIGSSQVVGPNGTVFKRSGRRVESGTVDIDVTLARNKKINSRNDIIKSRRTGLYTL